MSMQPSPWPEPDPQVTAAIKAIYRRKAFPLAVQVRDMLGEVYADEQFAGLFGSRGRPGYSPGRLALVSVLQMAEKLTDRQAAEAAGRDLSWKYALVRHEAPLFRARVRGPCRWSVAAGW